MTTNPNSLTNDLRDRPAYGLAEASRYLKLAAATLRSWLVGRKYPKGDGTGHWKPLILPSQMDPLLLSFWNLVEAHVLRALRTSTACGRCVQARHVNQGLAGCPGVRGA